jgi:hypothetical protein
VCIFLSICFYAITGLTASSGIGEYVAELYANVVTPGAVKVHASAGNQLQGRSGGRSWWDFFTAAGSSFAQPALTVAPDGLVGISQCARNPLQLTDINRRLLPHGSVNNEGRAVVVNGQVPSLQKLTSSFSIANNGERFVGGSVDLYGRPHRVTHAISSFGMESMD